MSFKGKKYKEGEETGVYYNEKYPPSPRPRGGEMSADVMLGRKLWKEEEKKSENVK